LCVLGAGKASRAFGQEKERPVATKPEKTIIDPSTSQADIIVLKFREGSSIRLRDDEWVVTAGLGSADDLRRLERANLDPARVLSGLELVNGLIQSSANASVARLFNRPEEELDLEKQIGEENSNEELADLNLYYYVFLDNGRVEDGEAMIDNLNASEIVEVAYPQPIFHLAQAPSTPDLTSEQTYLDAASVTTPTSNGLDSRYAWTLAGGKGDGEQIMDIEFDFRDGHEDLPGLFNRSGWPDGQLASRNHGAAVLGVLAGIENSYGITGMANRAQVGVAHPNVLICTPTCRLVFDMPSAVNRAAAPLRAGDVMLIEVQIAGPTGGLTCNTGCGNCSQFGDVAVEWDQATYDAIRTATVSNLIVVVEAAGNGQMNLDDSRYNRAFDRSFRDSFAIMVGAGTSNGRSPMCWTNAGTRLDVQGWGQNVVTAGYGDRFGSSQGLPETRWYTSVFSGTSSGSAIVAGAAAEVEGVRRTRGLQVLSSIQLRGLLRETGVTQASGRQIGPLPNLKDAIAIYIDGGTTVFFRYGIPDQPFLTIAEGLAAAWDQAQLKITARNYPETPTITRPMFLMSQGGTVTIGQ
jgi:hypothetical protein